MCEFKDAFDAITKDDVLAAQHEKGEINRDEYRDKVQATCAKLSEDNSHRQSGGTRRKGIMNLM